MIEAHLACLEALDALTQPRGEFCTPFLPIQDITGYDRRIVRRNIRALARKGLAQYFRGLSTEDGDFAGAGYCITDAGRAALSVSEPPKTNES